MPVRRFGLVAAVACFGLAAVLDATALAVVGLGFAAVLVAAALVLACFAAFVVALAVNA